tara:strand:- start:62 stop:343 length:282 start_codon:yes stop_codon:yes gene_type:complete
MAIEKNTYILFLLIILTLLSFFMIEDAVGSGWTRWASYIVVIITTFKARMIILHYMEVNHAPKKWRLMYETWYISVGMMLVIAEVMTAPVLVH